MKKFIFLLIGICLFAGAGNALECDTIIARRGDSWENLAAKYFTDVQTLKSLNHNLGQCYVGMKIAIPVNNFTEDGQLNGSSNIFMTSKYQNTTSQNGTSSSTNTYATSTSNTLSSNTADAQETAIESFYSLAERYIESGKLKDAKKTYDKLIKKYPSGTAYYMRGLVEFDRKKWRQSHEDLSKALKYDDLSLDMRATAQEFSKLALHNHEVWQAEQNEMVANLIGGLANLAGDIASGISQAKAQKQTYAYSSGSSTNKVTTSSARKSARRHTNNRSRNNYHSGSTHSSHRSTSHSSTRSSSSKSHSKSYSHSSPRNNSKSSRTYSSSNRSSKKSYSSNRSSTNTPRNSYKGYQNNSSSHQYHRYSSTGNTSHSSSGRSTYGSGESATMKKFNEAYQKYMTPEAFVYNYTHGLPTLPSSSELGISGLNAYSYDLQRDLLGRQQMMDLQAMQQTQALIEDGMKKAEEEIRNFKSLYGREPTPEEISMIYQKHTQGYLDAYTTYVTETTSTAKELGLGNIRDDDKKGSSDDSDSSDSDNGDVTTKGDNNKKDKEKDKEKNKEKNNTKKTGDSNDNNNNNNDGGYIYKQYTVSLRKYSTPKIIEFKSCKVYEKGTNKYVLVHGEYCKILPANKSGFSHKIVYGSGEYYF